MQDEAPLAATAAPLGAAEIATLAVPCGAVASYE